MSSTEIALMPNAQLDSIPGAGHITLFLDYSPQLLQQIRNALLAYR